MLWKRIELDDFGFPDVQNIKSYKKDYIKHGILPSEGVELCRTNKDSKHIELNERGRQNSELISFVDRNYNSGIFLSLSRNVKIQEPISVEFNMDDKNPVVIDKNIIIAEPGSEATVIIDYSSDDTEKVFHSGLTVVHSEENSVINIIKVQRMNSMSRNLDSNIAVVEGHGKVNWISVELGSDVSGVNFLSILKGEASESGMSSIYLVDGERRMDLEYSMIHRGVRSVSSIESKGVLKDNARKVFRGNIDFKRGARSSKGVEEEYVILMDPEVKSDSIPALMCGEDDVIGEHAASAGQIDENKLFYLMSRGLSERDAKKLIVEASFAPIISRIPVESLQTLISNEVERRLVNA